MLEDLALTPASVTRFTGDQLAIDGPVELMARYCATKGRWRHGPRTCDHYGYRSSPIPASRPNCARDIGYGTLKTATNLVSTDEPALRGVFHMAARGEASWADFAEVTFAASAGRSGPSALVRRIGTADYPTPATRPANSRLDCSRIARIHCVVLPDWRSSLETVVARLSPAAN